MKWCCSICNKEIYDEFNSFKKGLVNDMSSLSKTSIKVLFIVLLVMVLSACAGTIQTVEVTRIVPETVVVTQLIVVTATPEPPTPTPEASPTPTFQQWAGEDLVQALQNAGLEVEGSTPMTKDDYGMAPMVAVDAIHFFIPSLCSDCGGRIYSFSSQNDLDLMKTYYEDLGKSSALFFSWVFAKDNLLIQINGDLPEDKAREYENVLLNLGL